MPKYTLEEATSFGVLPEDTIIQVEVEDITEKAVPGKNGKEGWTKIEFKFLITGLPDALKEEYGNLVDTRIWGSVGARFTDHPDNKLRQWAEALLGLTVSEPGFELDTDVLIGRKARAVTSQYDKRDGTKGHQVAALLPAAGNLSAGSIGAVADLVIQEEPAQQPVGVTAMSTLDDEPPPF